MLVLGLTRNFKLFLIFEIIYLDSGLGKIKSECEPPPGEDVWVLSLLKCSLQLVELEGGEGCPGSSHLPRSVISVPQPLVVSGTAASCEEFLLLLAIILSLLYLGCSDVIQLF